MYAYLILISMASIGVTRAVFDGTDYHAYLAIFLKELFTGMERGGGAAIMPLNDVLF